MIKLGTPQERETGASGRYDMKAGERFLLQTAGGGGYGDPLQRAREAVLQDLAEGYVSQDAAAKLYRCNV